MVVDYLEKYAYEYGTTNGYLKAENFPEQRYPTFKMFDMLSATSTSSVLAAAISVPSQTDKTKNEYFAKDIYSLYEEYASVVFRSSSIGILLLVVIVIVSVIVGGGLGYLLGEKVVSNNKVEDALAMMDDYILKSKLNLAE